MPGQLSKLRRREAHSRAETDVYRQNPPVPVAEMTNPFEGKQADQYTRFYNQIRNRWLFCEGLLDDLGGRGQRIGG